MLTYRHDGEKGIEMKKIRNDREYRLCYEILHDVLERLAETDGCTEARTERIIELKRSLREYAHRDNTIEVGPGFRVESRLVRDFGDGFIELVSIPEAFDTLEDDENGPGADTFFKDFLYIHMRPSPYDCTGQAFTEWYKLFRRHGRFWAYHSVGFDV